MDILISHGARTSHSVVKRETVTKNLAIAVYFLLYAACLPPLLVYTTDDIWTSMTEPQKFGFMYLWAVIALLFPPLHFVINWSQGPERSLVCAVRYSICAVFFLFNHIVLPLLVIYVNWQPWLTCRPAAESRWDCTNYTFLLPLVVGPWEYVLGSLLYKYGDWADWW